MADSRITKRGKAVVEGVDGALDVVVYPVQQSAKATQNWDAEELKDEGGFDMAWLSRNHHYLNDHAFKIVGDTAAHAAAGGVFLAPWATVTISGFDLAQFNGTYQNISGAEIDLGNTKVGDLMLKLRKYADSTQNTLSQTTPS